MKKDKKFRVHLHDENDTEFVASEDELLDGSKYRISAPDYVMPSDQRQKMNRKVKRHSRKLEKETVERHKRKTIAEKKLTLIVK